MKMQEKLLRKHRVFNGKIFSVDHELVKIPDGSKAIRDVVHHARDVAMLVVNQSHQIILEKQWREALNQITIETPAGKVDTRDRGDSRHAALRELNEEVRITPRNLRQIAIGYNSPGFTDETTDFYLATDLKPVQRELPRDRGEYIHLFSIPLEEALAMVKNGQIRDGKTDMVIWYWQSLIQKHQIHRLRDKITNK